MEDSPSSASEDDTQVATPLPKKRRGVQKRVVSVPIGDVEGSKSKGEGHPPSDSWAWRKYGQKPIKGSPYPRGYYRCSSSKGCPARKQVERSRLNPTMLIVTYVCDHNHPMPTTKANQSSSVTPTTITATATSPTTESELQAKTEELTIFTSQVDLDLSDDSPTLLSDFGWFNDAASTVVLESPICLGNSSCMNNDVATRLKDEDEYLFADLGELPEGSVIFRHRNRMVESDDQNRRCSLSAVVPYCSNTG
ncbi:hypothetical protein FF2_046220 [Malus domestica]|uniref:WRKY domain-containing protein n=1 Tax=Malus domestica TaxID=3750 RepID=A0A498J3D6_MALDO|nr:hypothetical protein DVH24_006095 [Malus domestica]